MDEKSLDKKFGLMLSVLSVIFAIHVFKKSDNLSLFFVLILMSIILVLIAFFASKVLSPFTKIWMKFGMLLNKLVSPLILGVVFFGVITPVALFFRLLRRDLLRLKWDNSCSTYWSKRDTPGPLPQEMENPF